MLQCHDILCGFYVNFTFKNVQACYSFMNLKASGNTPMNSILMTFSDSFLENYIYGIIVETDCGIHNKQLCCIMSKSKKYNVVNLAKHT